jgi:two-component system, LytTR family, response regulator AlgR
MPSQSAPLRILIVDDEPPARARLRELLADLQTECPHCVVGEAADGLAALALLADQSADLVLSDIRMPGMDGIELAGHLAALPQAPAVVFVTAYDNFAVQAFDLDAVDYLMKPVRAQRLLAALRKLPPARPSREVLRDVGQQLRGGGRTHLPCSERGRLLLVSVADILYLRADLKYVTARTREREYLLDETLTRLEEEFPQRFLRLHRAVLVARDALTGLERLPGEDAEAYGWALLREVSEKLPVSRRQWSEVRGLIRSGG